MALPGIAPFPEAAYRTTMSTEDWEASLDAFITLIHLHLRLPAEAFQKHSMTDLTLLSFLTSYAHEIAVLPRDGSYFHSSGARTLHQTVFRLYHRFLSGQQALPSAFLEWEFLADLATSYPGSKAFTKMMHTFWTQHRQQAELSFSLCKKKTIALLEARTSASEQVDDVLKRFCSLMRASPDAGHYMMLGSDFLDALYSRYENAPTIQRRKILSTAYISLLSLADQTTPKLSLLLDHLYSLKAMAQPAQKSTKAPNPFLADLVSETAILAELHGHFSTSNVSRAKALLSSLELLRRPGGAWEHEVTSSETTKGKGREQGQDEYGHGAFSGVHVHRMSLISQIQDLFPDLGAGFVIKLLDAYGDNVEQVTEHLLEGSLPTYLAEADRTEPILPNHAQANSQHVVPPNPTKDNEAVRRNVFDNDELDNLAVDASRLHIGRKNKEHTADTVLQDRSNAPSKAAILSALAVFDADDDERDDTYDLSDVGGTVDSTGPGGPEESGVDLRDVYDEALFRAYKLSPDTFERDAVTRRGKARFALKSETGMTDEAIEGWAIMIGRDPRRLRRLEARYATFGGQQRELAPTAWRAGGEDADGSDTGQGYRGGRGRGRGRGGRGAAGGSSVAGPSGERNTQISRERKEVNKGSRANHNRRDQRARKVARGGFGP